MTRSVGPTGERVAWAGAERTESMYCMSVTLDVLKVSGWLNADAPCRIQREAELRGRQAGQEAGGRGGRRGAHLKHVRHVRDAGRVEAQRLVERIRALPSAKAGIA